MLEWKRGGEIVQIELSQYEISIKNITENTFDYHFNMYLRLNVSQTQDASSIHRLNRTLELISGFPNKQISNEKQILEILGDTNDPEYPIYRNASNGDCCATLITTVWNLQKQEFYWFQKCNPKLDSCLPYVSSFKYF